MLKVLLTHPSSTHSYYAELAANPPDGVVFLENHTHSNPRLHSRLREGASLLLRMFRLPHMRIIRQPTKSQIKVIHSCQNLLLSRQPWVVDIEHACPFVGIHFHRLENTLLKKITLALLTFPSCSAILPWTHTAARGFIKTLSPNSAVKKKIRVVYPAVRAPIFSRRIHTAECRLLFVANPPLWNFFLKGGRELIAAYRVLKSKRQHLSLTIVGPIPPDIAAQCQHIPDVVLTGTITRTELDRLYCASDIYVMPSFSDTFGMVFLEAMAFSLPVVALNRPYTQEIIQNDETGLLIDFSASSIRWVDSDGRFLIDSEAFISRVTHAPIDAGVVNGLVEKIGCLVDNPHLRLRLGTNGREEVTSGRFSIPRRNTILKEVYQEAVELSARSDH
jgi:glycosyltransferase involved in cell wall biosynthesis